MAPEPPAPARFADPESDVRRRHRPDDRLAIGTGGGGARCSLWWRKVPSLPGERLGVIGRYAAEDGAAGRQALGEACRRLRDCGCTLAVGPMDGNTWRRYRLVTERGTEPPFFLEPDNPDDWPGHFRSAGFKTLASYVSTVHSSLGEQDPRLPEASRRLERRGVRIRGVDASRFDEELKRIHAVAAASFRRNFLYTDIGESEFLEQYRPVREAVEPELSLLATQGDAPVGFIFAFPDLAQRRRGETVTRVVVKTLACLPGRGTAGLGAVLLARVRRAARERGCASLIHALMHEDNVSTNFSPEHRRVLRRYELFSRRLAPAAAPAGVPREAPPE